MPLRHFSPEGSGLIAYLRFLFDMFQVMFVLFLLNIIPMYIYYYHDESCTTQEEKHADDCTCQYNARHSWKCSTKNPLYSPAEDDDSTWLALEKYYFLPSAMGYERTRGQLPWYYCVTLIGWILLSLFIPWLVEFNRY